MNYSISDIFVWKKERALLYGTLDEELCQNDLTEELTIENSNIVINLAATLDVLGNFLVPIF